MPSVGRPSIGLGAGQTEPLCFYTRNGGDRRYLVAVTRPDGNTFTISVHANASSAGEPGSPATYPALVLQETGVAQWFSGAAESVAPDDAHQLVGGVLFRLPGTAMRYIHVGCEVQGFTTEEPITEYHAPVATDGDSLPVAYSGGCAYFLHREHRFVTIEEYLSSGADPSQGVWYPAFELVEPRVVPLSALPHIDDRVYGYNVYHSMLTPCPPAGRPGAILANLALLDGHP